MLQPMKRAGGVTPTKIALTGVGVIAVIIVASTVIHVILGIAAFIVEALIIGAIAYVALRLIGRARRSG